MNKTLYSIIPFVLAALAAPVAAGSPNPPKDNVGAPVITSSVVRGGGRSNTVFARDIFSIGGTDFDRWPYIEHSFKSGFGVQGINFIVPDRSTFAWRFITRTNEKRVVTRASIDALGNATFMGNVLTDGVQVGTPGLYTSSAVSWGNHLGGDFKTTVFSSAVKSVEGIVGKVFGISYSGIPVLAQDGYGNLGVFGAVTAKNLNADNAVSGTLLRTNGTSITSGNGAPPAPCSTGDIYARKDGAAGSTLYTCAAANQWIALRGSSLTAMSAESQSFAPPASIFVQSQFSGLALNGKEARLLTTTGARLGNSAGPKQSWYVCAIVEATVAGAHDDGAVFGIAPDVRGSGTAFRMYAAPQSKANSPRFKRDVLSDWPAAGNTATNGRYCNTYASQALVTFRAYAVAAAKIYSSGQLEVQATPQ